MAAEPISVGLHVHGLAPANVMPFAWLNPLGFCSSRFVRVLTSLACGRTIFLARSFSFLWWNVSRRVRDVSWNVLLDSVVGCARVLCGGGHSCPWYLFSCSPF